MIDWEDIVNAEAADELKEAKLWLFKENMRLENERTKLETEKRRLKDENLFFDKKLAILQDGFRHLEEDRRAFERQKSAVAKENRISDALGTGQGERIGELLFRSANNPLGLRKRYKDLIKIFHPDNLFGDDELSQIINKEFQRRRKEV
ncbi:MAG: hypothetical protein LUG83_09325 [Lachnospiraceae bacterium]|nr:hypothetical protein [Lachnospiraceae bacterium]